MANEFKIKKGLIVTGASGGTVVDIQGSLGQLFSVTDNLSGDIFAVSDISGVPIFKVNSSGLSTFTGLTSGITPVNAANFVTKAYADGLTPGAGVFLPLIGGTLSGPGNLTVGGTLTGTTASFNSGATNVVASFISTDGIAGIKLQDSGGNVELSASGNTFQVQPAGGVAALSVTSTNATFQGDVEIRTGKKLILQRPNNGVATEIRTDAAGTMILNSVNDEGFKFQNAGTTFLTLDTSNNATFTGDIIGGGSITIGSGGAYNAGAIYSDANWGMIFRALQASPNNSDFMFANSADVERLRITSTTADFSVIVDAPTFVGDLNGTINTLTTGFTQANAIDNTTIATTAYVNNKIALIPAGLLFEGTWDARTVAEGGTGNPPSASPANGQFWIVSVDGSTNLSGITDWKVGDWAIYVVAGAGADGWQKVDNSSVLDGSGTGNQSAKWAGSGTSNTLTNGSIEDEGTILNAIRINSTSDTTKNYIGMGRDSTNNQRLSLAEADSNGSHIRMVNSRSGGGYFVVGVGDTNSSSSIVPPGGMFFYNGTTKMVINSAGNVGIGTTNPTQKLQLGVNGSLIDSIRIGTYNVAKNTRQYIGYTRADSGLFETTGNGDTPSTVLPGVAGIRIVNTTGTNASGQADNSVQLLTHIYNGGSRVALHASYNGRVGIGTTSPNQKLDVEGNVVIPYANGYFMDTVGAGASNFIKTVNSFETVVGTDRGSAGFGVFGNSNIRLGFGTDYTTAQTKLTLNTNGLIQFNAYNLTNQTGTPTFLLGTDASGNVVKTLSTPSPITSQAASLYDLIPNGAFTTTYAFTSTAGTYAEVMSGNDVITAAGTYSVQMYVSDYAVGGTQYREYYSGVMSWNYPDNTNDDGIGAVSEIVLHRAGHAANSGITYLRTRETGAAESNELKLEIMCNKTYTGASNVVFKFVRLI